MEIMVPDFLTFHLYLSPLLCCVTEVMVSGAKADLALQDADRNTALHLACSKVRAIQRQEMFFSHSVLKMLRFSCGLSVSGLKLKVVTIQI